MYPEKRKEQEELEAKLRDVEAECQVFEADPVTQGSDK